MSETRCNAFKGAGNKESCLANMRARVLDEYRRKRSALVAKFRSMYLVSQIRFNRSMAESAANAETKISGGSEPMESAGPAESLQKLPATIMDSVEQQVRQSMRDEQVARKILEEEKGPLGELSEGEIDEMLKELERPAGDPTEADYSLFSLYMAENQPICPYCSSILTFFDGNLYCESKGCITLSFKAPVRNIADIAWQMKNMHDAHADTGCDGHMNYAFGATSGDLLFAECEKCKYLNYIQVS